MVKTDSKRINVRLRTPVRYALEDLMERWGLGMTPTLEKLILDTHGGVATPERDAVVAVKSELKVEYDAE